MHGTPVLTVALTVIKVRIAFNYTCFVPCKSPEGLESNAFVRSAVLAGLTLLGVGLKGTKTKRKTTCTGGWVRNCMQALVVALQNGEAIVGI